LVLRQPRQGDFRPRGFQRLGRGGRAVGGAVVDDDGFPGNAQRVQRGKQLARIAREVSLLVVAGDDDG
jgi:hypothetical protein